MTDQLPNDVYRIGDIPKEVFPKQGLLCFCSVCGAYLLPDDGVVDTTTGEIICRGYSEPAGTAEEFVAKYGLGRQNLPDNRLSGYDG
jgi:hypothetical protein